MAKKARMSSCPHGENVRMAKMPGMAKNRPDGKKPPHGPCPHGKKAVSHAATGLLPQSQGVAPQGFPAAPSNTHSGAAHRAAPPSSFAARRQASKNANQALSPEPFAPAFAFLSSLVREVLAALLAQSIINP